MAWDLDNPLEGYDNPQYNGSAPTSSGFDWKSGLTSMGSDIFKSALPGLVSGAVGFGLNKLMPGQAPKNTLTDTRTPEQQGAAQFGLSRLNSLSQNPSGFGLPGSPDDPNTPAGRKKLDIVNGVRSADAARGMFSTGGSAQRETDALNREVGNSFNTNIQTAGGLAQGTGPMAFRQQPGMENPWTKLIGAAVDPAIRTGIGNLLQKWGLA